MEELLNKILVLLSIITGMVIVNVIFTMTMGDCHYLPQRRQK